MNEVERRLSRLEERAQDEAIAAMSDEELDAMLDEDPIGRRVLAAMTDAELEDLASGKPAAVQQFTRRHKELSASQDLNGGQYA